MKIIYDDSKKKLTFFAEGAKEIYQLGRLSTKIKNSYCCDVAGEKPSMELTCEYADFLEFICSL